MKSASKNHYAVIMAGGRGERFWPLSREKRPKQLLPLLGKTTLIEDTIARLKGVVPEKNIWIITNKAQAPAIRKLLPRIPAQRTIAEPEGRDSAGATLLGAAFVAHQNPKAVIAFLPADQLITNISAYRRALKMAFKEASRNTEVVTLGHKPTSPHTGYGYIEGGKRLKKTANVSLYRVKSFREKPTVAVAKKMLKAGNFFWNLGIFVWSLEMVNEGFKKSAPHAAAWPKAARNPIAFLKHDFKKLPKISIDYAVMEKMKNILTVTGDFGWDDIGCWNALYEHLKKDRDGNVVRGPVAIHESSDCLTFSKDIPIALLGVRGLIVVQTSDAILVCHREKGQQLKKLVSTLPKKLR